MIYTMDAFKLYRREEYLSVDRSGADEDLWRTMRGMLSEDVSFSFELVEPSEVDQAFAFHRRVAETDEHIWPRTLDQIHAFAADGELFAVRRGDTQEYVALCYATLDGEHGDEWEVGGLTVDPSVQNLGIGTLLVRLTVAHTIAMNEPMKYGQIIIAHVHEANQDPRNLLVRLGFEQYDRVCVPAHLVPATMRRNSEGDLVGDKYRLSTQGVRALSKWLDEDFAGTLSRYPNPVTFRLRQHTLEHLRNMIRAIARQVPP
jgi:GNAT superfamily N-acetyltransferase